MAESTHIVVGGNLSVAVRDTDLTNIEGDRVRTINFLDKDTNKHYEFRIPESSCRALAKDLTENGLRIATVSEMPR